MSEIITGVIAISIAVVLSVVVESSACHSRYGDLGKTTYGPIKGCMVKIGDRTIPVESLRIEP